MIITIRNQFKQSTVRYVALFIVVALSVGMVSIPSLLRHGGEDGAWVCKVNGEKVSYRNFAQEVAEQSEFLAQIRAQYGQYADLLMQAMNWPTDPKALAFEVLIKIALLDQLVNNIGIHINSQYIAESINNAQFARQHLQRILPLFLFDSPTGTLNSEKLKMFLQHKGMSIRDFEHKIEQSLAQLQSMQFIASTCYVPLFDLEQEFIAQNLGKEFSYLAFSLDSFLAAEKKKNISDEDALDFYTKENNQRRRYWVPEKRDGIVWRFDAKSYGSPISEEHMNQYYEDNKVSKYVLEPVKVHVQQITEKQLAQHPDMTLEMVKEEIQNNPASVWAKKWESVEPFARGEQKGAFEKEAFLLQNVGDISSVIETKDGKVILQLVKRIPRTYKPFATVKNEIKNILVEKHFKKNFVKDLKSIAGDSQAIESFIAQKGGKKELVAGVLKNDTMLSQELFGLKKGEYAFFVENEVGIAVLLTNIVEKHLPEFSSIKNVVKDDLREERAYDAMMSSVQEAKKAADTLSFEAIAKEYNVPLHHTGIIQPGDNKKMQELDKKGLPARTMLGLNKEGLVLLHNDDRTSFLIKVDAIDTYDDNDLLRAEEEIKSRIMPHRMKAQVESAIASLHRNATIETNESILIASEEYSE